LLRTGRKSWKTRTHLGIARRKSEKRINERKKGDKKEHAQYVEREILQNMLGVLDYN
jgi:hypothetical protein